jgi:hypothetical protein
VFSRGGCLPELAEADLARCELRLALANCRALDSSREAREKNPMSPLAGIVIEYLVVGSTTALWIMLLLGTFGKLPTDLPDPIVILLLPLLYVLGMLSDRLGRLLIEKPKKTLEGKLQKENPVSTQDVHSRLVVHQPALALQLEARRTRDRVARGVLANVPFLTLSAMIWASIAVGQTCAVVAVALAGTLLYAAVLSMWRRYQKLSSQYEILCDKRLREHSAKSSP